MESQIQAGQLKETRPQRHSPIMKAVFCVAITTFKAMLRACVVVAVSSAIAQTTNPANKTVRISGRLVDRNGNPVSLDIRMARWDADGFKNEKTPTVGPDGRFTVVTAPSQKYRFCLPSGWGLETSPKSVDALTTKNIDLGDVVVEICSRLTRSNAEPPSTPAIGDLKLEQIIIEPNEAKGPNFTVIGVLSTFKPNPIELPTCPTEPTLDNRSEWEEWEMITLNKYVTLESFVGGRVKNIRVVRHDPKLTPTQIREEVRKVWLGRFRSASSFIRWAEYTRWNIQASVEFEDGKHTSIVMDGWIHVQVEDREGKLWYIRLLPAVD